MSGDVCGLSGELGAGVSGGGGAGVPGAAGAGVSTEGGGAVAGAGGTAGKAGALIVVARSCLSPRSQTHNCASGLGGSGRLISTACFNPGPGSGTGRPATSSALLSSHPSF